MPEATNGPTRLHYDTFGSPDDPALLLIMGLGAQMNAWREDFCQLLADERRHVIRFDNRDVGLSSKTEGTPPNILAMMMSQLNGGDPPEAPYVLSDMAADAIAVIDAVGVDRVDVAGASMGGMIAQTVAIEHPDRVRSLTSIMSTTGASDVGQPEPSALPALMAPPATTRDGAIEQGVRTLETIGGPLFDADDTRAHVIEAYDRCYHPSGVAFQLAAIVASGDRTNQLGQLDVACTVIHGRVDPLVTLSGGEATASAVPGAELVVHDEMGHDLPRPLWSEYVRDLLDVSRRGG